ncbi:MAG: hypothetical protein LBC74_13875 [Planctomycetaceae bacterium]|jgi:hypothetical protein|nr:hypothetical protein [Planctomycetaceae bacterium]
MELVDGVFWGFSNGDGFDIDMYIEDNRITEFHNMKILRADNFPYAYELELFDYTYYEEKYCPFDDRLLPKIIKTDNDQFIEIKKLIDDNFYRLHCTLNVYCSGRVDLCGGNKLNGIVPCHYMIVSEEMKDNIIKEKIEGCSFFNITVNPNQTSIDNVSLFGINMKYISATDLYSYFDDIPFSDVCPFCNKAPIACYYCKTYPKHCPYCGKKIASYISSMSEIDNKDETLPYLICCDFNDENIIPGEYWQGEDLLEITGARVSVIGTKRFFDFMEQHQYGPLVALPFQVDVSRCTNEQKDRIRALLD